MKSASKKSLKQSDDEKRQHYHKQYNPSRLNSYYIQATALERVLIDDLAS